MRRRLREELLEYHLFVDWNRSLMYVEWTKDWREYLLRQAGIPYSVWYSTTCSGGVALLAFALEIETLWTTGHPY